MISEGIHQKIAEALKAKDETRLSTLRLLASALNYENISKQHKLSSEEELVVVKKEAKKRKDAIAALRQAQGKRTVEGSVSINDRIKREERELEILKELLPEEMSDEELARVVEETLGQMGLSGIQNMGKVIGSVMVKTKGRAEGSKVAEMVRQKLV